MDEEQCDRIKMMGHGLTLHFLLEEADIKPIELEYAIQRGVYKIKVEKIRGSFQKASKDESRTDK